MLPRLQSLIVGTAIAFIGLLVIAFFVGIVVALWMLILGKFERPRKCPTCGAELPSKLKQSAASRFRDVYHWGAVAFFVGLSMAMPQVYHVRLPQWWLDLSALVILAGSVVFLFGKWWGVVAGGVPKLDAALYSVFFIVFAFLLSIANL